MPRETIQTGEGAFSIGWARDGQVQVAADRTTDGQDAEPTSDHQWVTLDRRACNRAIQALRRARDAAYGADA